MTLEQIHTILKNAGFTVKIVGMSFEISLNRLLHTSEVWAALGYQISQNRLTRKGSIVVIK